MIYFYDVCLLFKKNNDNFTKVYRVSFCELLDFLNKMKKRNSSMLIYYIKPYYYGGGIYKNYN